MKLNRGMLWATVTAAAMLVVGAVTVTVVGIDRAPATRTRRPSGPSRPRRSAVDGDATEAASNAPGTEEYRGGGSHGGGARGGGSHGGGSQRRPRLHPRRLRPRLRPRRLRARRRLRRGWGGSRWGRWGGGRYVGGRWVGGPYYGWCDDRYYACNRYWW